MNESGMLNILEKARGLLRRQPVGDGFTNSAEYWQARYVAGRDSGSGSYNRLAEFKAETLNTYVAAHGIASVIEFGCGDGAQLGRARYPSYLGIDVAPRALDLCRAKFGEDASKSFAGSPPEGRTFDLALSLDVLYHLVEDEVYEAYMRALFASSHGHVAIYSSDVDKPWSAPHVRHRNFSAWVIRNRPDWTPVLSVPNPYPYDEENRDQTSFADFAFYRRS